MRSSPPESKLSREELVEELNRLSWTNQKQSRVIDAMERKTDATPDTGKTKRVAKSSPAAEPATVSGLPEGTEERQPETLNAPRGDGKDDLKRISGVGPKLEETLNDMGFFHFDQIAAWGNEEIAWVDARLRFKGRIVRDNWVAQAAELAKG